MSVGGGGGGDMFGFSCNATMAMARCEDVNTMHEHCYARKSDV